MASVRQTYGHDSNPQLFEAHVQRLNWSPLDGRSARPPLVTLPAFAVERRAAALLLLGAGRASVDRYLMPDGLTAANPTHGTTISDQGQSA